MTVDSQNTKQAGIVSNCELTATKGAENAPQICPGKAGRFYITFVRGNGLSVVLVDFHKCLNFIVSKQISIAKNNVTEGPHAAASLPDGSLFTGYVHDGSSVALTWSLGGLNDHVHHPLKLPKHAQHKHPAIFPLGSTTLVTSWGSVVSSAGPSRLYFRKAKQLSPIKLGPQVQLGAVQWPYSFMSSIAASDKSIHVAWIQPEKKAVGDNAGPNKSRVLAATGPIDGAGFGTPHSLGAPSHKPSLTNQSLAVAPDGAVHLVWSAQGAPTKGRVHHATRTASGKWSAPQVIAGQPTGLTMRSPVIAIGNQVPCTGTVFAAWHGSTSGGVSRIYVARLLAGKTSWSEPMLVSKPTKNSVTASIAVNENCTVGLAWAETTASDHAIKAAALQW